MVSHTSQETKDDPLAKSNLKFDRTSSPDNAYTANGGQMTLSGRDYYLDLPSKAGLAFSKRSSKQSPTAACLTNVFASKTHFLEV